MKDTNYLCYGGHDVVTLGLYNKVSGKRMASVDVCVRCRRVMTREPMGLMVSEREITAWIEMVRKKRRKATIKPV